MKRRPQRNPNTYTCRVRAAFQTVATKQREEAINHFAV